MTRVTAGNEASIDDLNQIIDLLQGTSGFTESFLLRCATSSDFKVRLSDAAGARRFEIQDSAGTAVAYADSDGNLTTLGSFSPAGFVLPQSTAPSNTAEGSVFWDNDDDLLKIGTGAATKVIGLSRGAGSNASATAELVYDTTAAALKVWDGSASVNLAPAVVLAGSSTAATSTTSTSAVDLVTISGLSILVSQPFRVEVNYRKQALAANAAYIGIKQNSTVTSEASSTTYIGQMTSNSRAEEGIAVASYGPRSSANYLQGMVSWHATRVSSTGATAGTPAINNLATTAANVNATITSLAIRAINDTASNAVEVSSVRVLTGIM